MFILQKQTPEDTLLCIIAMVIWRMSDSNL